MNPMTPSSSDLAEWLGDLLPRRTWRVDAAIGTTGTAFICSAGTDAVVVKFSSSVGPLKRLASLGVTPPLISIGESPCGPFVVQPLIRGLPLDGRWIERHFDLVAELLHRVHTDVTLGLLAAPLLPTSLVEAVARRVGRLLSESPDIGSVGRTADALCGELLAPGQRQWQGITEGCETIETDACLRWWVAAESLDVAVGLMQRRSAAATTFLGDARSALDGRPNPRGWWLRNDKDPGPG